MLTQIKHMMYKVNTVLLCRHLGCHSNDELLILYAMVNKIKISPAQALVKQWLSNFKTMGPIECTSLITRIATCVGALEGNSIPFIEDDRAYIDESYLIQGHMLKRGPNDSLIFFFVGYTNKTSQPNAEFYLYNCRSLTIPLIPREGAVGIALLVCLAG